MADRITGVTSSNDGEAIASGGTVVATVSYRCESKEGKLSARGVTAGFTVSVKPEEAAATPGIAESEVTFALTLTRTSAAAGRFCEVHFSMNVGASGPTVQYYKVK